MTKALVLKKTIDEVTVEFQEDNFDTIKSNMEAERGNLLHRNLSTMIATSETVSTKSLTKPLAEKDPELLEIWQSYLAATDPGSKLSILTKLSTR